MDGIDDDEDDVAAAAIDDANTGKKSLRTYKFWSESIEYKKGSLQMRRGMRKMKQIFLHYHPRSVTMQPVHAYIYVCACVGCVFDVIYFIV